MAATEPKAVVVGAGMAGLGAAWHLARRGVAVAVLEREARPGGRASSVTQEGFTFEPSSSLLSTADRGLLAWIDEVGARDELLPLRLVVTSQVHRDRVSEVDPRGLLDYPRIPGVKPRQALRLLRLSRLMKRYGSRLEAGAPERAADLDDRSLADFGALYFGRSVVDYWMAPFLTADSLGDERETSRVHFLRRFRTHAGARRGLPRGALSDLLELAAGKLGVLYGAEVTGIEAKPRGSVTIAYQRDGKERQVSANAVVISVPAPDAARIAAPVLSSAERESLARIRYTPSLALAVAMRRSWTHHPQLIRVPHAEDSPLETALLEPGMIAGRVPDRHGSMTLRATGGWSEANFGVPDEAVEKELIGAFERFHPGARNAVLFSRVMRLARALPRFGVGHYREIARLARVEAEERLAGRRVYLAGDYRMDPSWSGALASGRRAAGAVEADLIT